MGSTPNGRIRIFFLRRLRHWIEKRKTKTIILNLSQGLRQPPFEQLGPGRYSPSSRRRERLRHFRNDKRTGAEMSPANVSGIVKRDALVSYWPDFPVSPVTVPEAFAKVNSAQISSSSKAWLLKYSFT